MLKRYSKLVAITFCCLFGLNIAKASPGCDTVYTTLTDTITCGDSITIGTNTYHLGGTYTDTLLTGLGCDSIVTLHLFAIGDTVNVFGGICGGDSVYFYGIWIYHPGEFDTILPGHGTCDTLASIFLAVIDPLPPHHTYDTICANDSLLFAGVYLHSSGVYDHIHCDSSVILTLTVLPTDSTVLNQSICGNDSFYFYGNYLSATGTYTEILTNHIGCDSFIILNLSVGTGTDTINSFGGLCAGDSVYFYGTWIHTPGFYDTILPGIGTCDTLATLSLVIQDPLPPHYLYDTICGNDSVYFAGAYFDTSGIYSHIGCDSSVILTLTVNTLPVVTFSWDSLAMLNNVSYVIQDTAVWCMSPNQFVLIGGYPSSGHYFGNGISNDTLYGYQAFQYPYNGERDTIVYWYTDNNNCSNSATGILIAEMCEGIHEINADNSIGIYPNPATTELFIKAENFRPEQLRLYDISGQVIRAGKFEPKIDISQLSSGVYFIEVKAGNEVARKRFVKM